MRAMVIDDWGGPEKLELREISAPRLGPGEVLVRVRAVGVCGRDLIDRRGGHRGARLPAVLGHEFAGEVEEVAPGVAGVEPGDRVASLLRSSCGACRACLRGEPTLCENVTHDFGHNVQGAYAELVVAPASTLVPIPEKVSFAQAAPLACTAGVALRALRAVGRLERGETVLLTGASGGVGTAAVQVAKRLGARVIAVTASQEKAARLTALGADEVVVTKDGDFHDQVQMLAESGVDLSLELTGSATFGSALRSLRRGGRLVLVGNIRTEPIKVNPGAVILFGYQILGTSSCTRQDLEDVLGWVARSEIVVVVDRELALADVADAHRALAERGVFGRIVLRA